MDLPLLSNAVLQSMSRLPTKSNEPDDEKAQKLLGVVAFHSGRVITQPAKSPKRKNS